MSYIFNHVALYDGQFNVYHLCVILASVAVIAYCVIKLNQLSKKKKALEKAKASSNEK